VVVIPDFDGDGALPPGIHEASWEEVNDRFGGSAHREELLAGLYEALRELKAAGCRRAFVDGSFVTDKEVPNDYDLCWDQDGVNLLTLDPVFRDVLPPRAAQQAKYRGDLLPNVTEGNSGQPFVDFFLQNKVTGKAKGIVAINLEEFA